MQSNYHLSDGTQITIDTNFLGEGGEGGEGGEANEGGKEGNPPPLAPLSLSGLALFGAVTLLGAKRES